MSAEIVLQFSTQNDVGGWAIRVFDHGFWATHVDSVLPGGDLLGARFSGGVAIRKPGYASFSRTQTVSLATTEDIAADYYAFLHQQLGKAYDVEAIGGFVVCRNWRDDDMWFCDELVFAGLERKFLPYKLPMTINRLTPADLMLVCSMFTDTSK